MAQKDILGFFHNYISPPSQLKLIFSPPCAQFFYDKEIPRYEVFKRKKL